MTPCNIKGSNLFQEQIKKENSFYDVQVDWVTQVTEDFPQSEGILYEKDYSDDFKVIYNEPEAFMLNSILKFATTEQKIQRLEKRKTELEDGMKYILATHNNVNNMEILMAEHTIVCNTLDKIDGIFNMMGAFLRG